MTKTYIHTYIYLFRPHLAARGILVPWSGIESGPSTVKAWSPNHWTAREFPVTIIQRKNIHLQVGGPESSNLKVNIQYIVQ